MGSGGKDEGDAHRMEQTVSVLVRRTSANDGGCNACASHTSTFALHFSRASNSVTEVRVCLACARDLRVEVSEALAAVPRRRACKWGGCNGAHAGAAPCDRCGGAA